MSYIDLIKDKARADLKTIVLPETRDKRTLIHEYADEQAVRDLKRKQHKYQKEHSQIQPKKTRDEQSR